MPKCGAPHPKYPDVTCEQTETAIPLDHWGFYCGNVISWTNPKVEEFLELRRKENGLKTRAGKNKLLVGLGATTTQEKRVGAFNPSDAKLVDQAFQQINSNEGNRVWLSKARDYAETWLRDHSGACITSAIIIQAIGMEGTTSSSVAGAIFHDKRFYKTGTVIPDTDTRHQRHIAVWMLRED